MNPLANMVPTGAPKTHRVHIPDIGTQLTLAEDWTFKLQRESRNWEFWKKINGEASTWSQSHDTMSFTIPAGSVLKVDRVYIRKGSGYGNFSSITFYLVSMPDSAFEAKAIPFAKKGNRAIGRFWAKLHDVNNMVVEGE